LRRRLLEGLDQKDLIVEDYVSEFSATFWSGIARPRNLANWDLKALKDAIFTRFGVDIYARTQARTDERQELATQFLKSSKTYDSKEKLIGAEASPRTSVFSRIGFRGAEAEFRRALQLNPNFATAHQWYAEMLTR